MKKFFSELCGKRIISEVFKLVSAETLLSFDVGSVMKAAKWHYKSATTAVLCSGSSCCSYHREAAIRNDRSVMYTNHQADVLQLSSVKMW